MKRYYIEAVKCGLTESGMACGPVSGSVVVTIQFREGNKTQWLGLVETSGFPSVYLSDIDVHDILAAEDFDDEFVDYMEDHFISDFNGIEMDVEYSTTFESIADDPENPAIPLIRYLITLARCNMNEVEGLIQMATGKYADELDIPMSDVEEEFIEESQEPEAE